VTKNWKSVSTFCLCIVAISVLLAGCNSNATASTPNFGTVPTEAPITTTTTTSTANVNVSAIPSIPTVNKGGNFDLSIQVSTSVPTRGFQCALTWDPTKVTCNSVEQGTFFTSFAQQNNITAQLMPGSLAVDNKIGKFPPGTDIQGTFEHNQAVFLIGGNETSDNTYPGPEGNGDVFILHMTALPDAVGTVTFTLANVEVDGNDSPVNVLTPLVNNGQITISGAK
jgi:hypothetical protein